MSKHNADFEQVLTLIDEARTRTFNKVNAELVSLYFNVGKMVAQRVSEGIWGEKTVAELANYLTLHLPEMSVFNRRGLYRMKQFYEIYSPASECFALWSSSRNSIVSPVATQLSDAENADPKIVSPLATQLQNADYQHNYFKTVLLTQVSWTNHLELFSTIKNPEQLLFYLLMSAKEKWSKLELRRQIQSAAFERTMLVNQMTTALPGKLPKNVFKDPYIFEFLNLPEKHSENDLEAAIVKNLQKFILEIGKGFTYMGSQYRLQVGNKDYYTDLLFYHRDLQCLILFELKIQEFEPEFLGKLNFYLEALDRDIKRPHEMPSIGILLCKGKDTEVVEYAMARNNSPALIADYETRLIDKKLLANKLHQLVEIFTKNIER